MEAIEKPIKVVKRRYRDGRGGEEIHSRDKRNKSTNGSPKQYYLVTRALTEPTRYDILRKYLEGVSMNMLKWGGVGGIQQQVVNGELVIVPPEEMAINVQQLHAAFPENVLDAIVLQLNNENILINAAEGLADLINVQEDIPEEENAVIPAAEPPEAVPPLQVPQRLNKDMAAARRTAIHYFFTQLYGSPLEDQWRELNLENNIMNQLQIPVGSKHNVPGRTWIPQQTAEMYGRYQPGQQIQE